MATVEIISEIYNSSNEMDLDAIRDASGSFSVFFVWNETVTGFSDTDIVLTGADAVVFRGSGCCYEYEIMPTGNDGDGVTVLVNTDAVSEGNAETTLTLTHAVRTVSTTELFTDITADTEDYFGFEDVPAIAVEKDRIWLSRTYANIVPGSHSRGIHAEAFDYDGTFIAGTRTRLSSLREYISGQMKFDILNGRLFYSSGILSRVIQRINIEDTASDVNPLEFVENTARDFGFANSTSAVQVPVGFTHTNYGLVGIINAGFGVFPYGGARDGSDTQNIDIGVDWQPKSSIAGDGDKVYVREFIQTAAIQCYRFTSLSNVEFIGSFTLDIVAGSPQAGLNLYALNGRLYISRFTGVATRHVHVADLPILDPPVSKFRNVPMFVRSGETIDLKQFATDADKVVWDVGYDLPSYLSIADSVLTVGTVSSETMVELRLKGLNEAGASANDAFGFYVVIRPNSAPVWNAIDALTIAVGSEIDLFDFVSDATAISFQTGQPMATGATLTNGRFVVDATADSEFTQAFTASRGSQSSNKEITFSVVNSAVVTQPSDIFRYRVEIAGVDVSSDLIGDPIVSQSLDAISINAFVIGDCQITLKNIGGKYSEETDNNFWETNNIASNGYLAGIKVYAELFDGSSWHPKIIFGGIILEATDSGSAITFGCRDQAYNLRIQDLYDIGEQKYAHVFGQDQEVYQGEYTPETTLLPILPSQYKVAGGATDLTLRQTANASEGLPQGDTAYVDDSGVFTAEGLRDENTLLLRYKTAFRDIGIKHLLRQLTSQTGLASRLDITEDTLSDAYHLNRGNIGFQANETRVVRVPTDWVYDSTRGLYFVLMSNYQNHIADQIVEYDAVADRFRVVYEFPTQYFCLNFATTDYETFYVLSAGAADFDRLRDTNETQDRFLTYDSTVSGHQNRILDVDITDGTLSVHVDTDDDYPPQVGMHYHAGFENVFYADLWRGVVAENRASFEIYNNLLYYRYAKSGEFGVASADTPGATSMVIDEGDLAFNNHLNFGFTINSSGDVLMPYVTSGTANSTLAVKQNSGGTVTTVFTNQVSLAGLTVLQPTGGYFLGVHEVVEHSGDLYCVVPIQRAFSVSGQTVSARIPRNAAGAVLYKIDTTADTLTVIKTYDFVTEACRSLVVHDSAVHFIESPSVAYRYRPINENLDSFNDNLGYNQIDVDGALYRLDSSDNPVNLGRVWYEDADYRGAMCKALSVGDDLNMVVGSQYSEQILATNSQASNPDNMLWVQRTNRLQYRLEDFSGDGSVYDALARLAEQTGGTLTASQDLIAISDREAYLATQDGVIGTTLPFMAANKTFPTSGYLLVDGEIIQYTGLAVAAFTGLTRGVLGTTQTTRTDAAIVYCDNIIHSDILKDPYLDVNKTNDVNNLYNVITDSGKLVRVEDATSISAYGEKVYSIDLGLSRHQSAWLETVYNKYLENLKDIHNIYGVNLTQAFYLNLGEVVPLFHGDIPIAVRIVGITWRGQTTSIQVRSV